MANPPSTARREEVAFHKEMVRQLKREISLIDRNSQRKYIREFDEEYRAYEELSSFDDLIVSAYKADIIYVGDYHALPQSQMFAARMLKEIASRSRNVHLAVEMVFGRSQQVLDRWTGGEIDDEEFLRRIRYHLDWGYDWESFRRIFAVARKHGLRVHGVDCEPRSGFRYIRKRDQYAAHRLVSILEKEPDAKIVVVFGESHVATGHLPARVRELLKKRNLERRGLIVVQNVERIYWQLAEKGNHHIDVVRCGASRFCVFNASPLAKYESYRQTIERWKVEGEDEELLDLTPTIYNMIDTILKFLRVDKYQHLMRNGDDSGLLVDAFPEVYSGVEMPQFRRTLQDSRFTADQIAEIEFHVGRNGSCYIPRINVVYIGRFNLVHGGEEAAHFVNMALRGDIFETGDRQYPMADLFYVTVLEEALGFFGSKLIDPSRNHFFETEFYRYYKKSPEDVERETPYRYQEFREIIDFILLHKRFERTYQEYDEVPEEILQGIHDPRRFSVLTHELGYFLGQQLYDGYHAGKFGRKAIQALFRRRFGPDGDALGVYLDLIETLSSGGPQE